MPSDQSAHLNRTSSLDLSLAFDAWLGNAFDMIIKQLLDVSAERPPILFSKLFKLGL